MKTTNRGFIKLILAIIGLLILLSLAGVKVEVVQNIATDIWQEIIIPVVEKIKSVVL